MDIALTFIHFLILLIPLVTPLILILVVIVIVLGQWVTHIEKWHKFDGLYWSFITATTVGYGDIRPIKKISKILAVGIAIIGLILGGIIVSLSLQATTFSVEKHIDESKIKQLRKELGPGVGNRK